MTKANLVKDFKNMIGPAGKGSEVDDPSITVWLNDAIDIVMSSIIDTIPDYFTKLQKASFTASEEEYDLPAKFEKAVLVSVTYDGTNWVRALPLNNISQALDIQQTGSSNFDVSQPYYYIYKDKIGFQPTPSSTISNSIKLWYAYEPTRLSEDSDEPDLPNRFQSILKYWAYANYLDQNDEHAAAERMRQRFDVMLEKLVVQLSDQQVDMPRTVEVWDDDQGLYIGDMY